MGSPVFAASVLQSLCNNASKFGIEVAGVVTQPNCKVNGATPVGKYARTLCLSNILTPLKPSEFEFIEKVKEMNIDICLTVAYGGFLPQKFLDIPKYGVYNIHPSLLPLYRGAAPVQRCIGDNCTETGVTVLKTVLKMDAGPILKQSPPIPLSGNEKACDLYEPLFRQGLNMFTQSLEHIFDNKVVLVPQDHQKVTYAKKIEPSEGEIRFNQMSAAQIYNRYRMLYNYLGIKVKLQYTHGNENQIVDVILCDVFIISPPTVPSSPDMHISTDSIINSDTTLLKYINNKVVSTMPYYEVICSDNSRLGIRSLQFPTKKILSAKEFNNGIRKVPLYYAV